MTSSSPEKKKRESSKTSLWEKERRNRINDYFKKLWEVLPVYDASKPLSKPDILLHAASTIKELDEKLNVFLVNSEEEKISEQKSTVSSNVIKKLQERVKKLLLRNEHLASLLKTTGIKIPSECGVVKKLKSRRKYINVISKEQEAKMLQKEMEKENQVKTQKPKALKPRARRKKTLTQDRNKASKKVLLSSQNCLFVVTQSSLQQNNSCFILSRPPGKSSQTVLTNSVFIKTPVASSQVKSSVVPAQSQLSGLLPGTLVFSNGTVMPVIPNPQPLPVLPTIFTNPLSTALSTLIVVSSKSNTTSTTNTTQKKTTIPSSLKEVAVANSLSVLRPRTSITSTTQVNKVPIPALTSKYNKYNCLNSGITSSRKSEPQKGGGKSESRKKGAEQSMQSEAKRTKVVSEVVVKTDQISKAIETDSPVKVSAKAAEQSTNQDMMDTVGEVDNGKPNKDALENELTRFVSTPAENGGISKETSDIFRGETLPNVAEVAIKPTDNSDSFLLDRLADTETNENPQPKTVKLQNNELKDTELDNNTVVKSTVEMTVPSCQKESDVVLNSLHADVINHQHSNNINDLKSLEMHLPQTELSNDIFASFQVPPGCQNQESTSPTAAFLLAFPLVSSGTKVAEVLGDENSESQTGTPNLLQIGTMDIAKPTQSYSESLTPNLLNFDSFSFFGKDSCAGFYNSGGKNIDGFNVSSIKSPVKALSSNNKSQVVKEISYNKFPDYQQRNVQKEMIGNSGKLPDLIQGGSSSTVDISTNIFSFKPSGTHQGYSNKNDAYSAKFSSHYSGYKNCTSSSANSNHFAGNNVTKQYAPVYTSAATSNSFYNAFGGEDMSGFTSSYTNDYNRKSFTNCNTNQIYQKDKLQNNNLQTKIKTPGHNKPINWMTTPSTTTSYKSDYFLPPFSGTSSNAFTNANSYFNTPTYTNSNEHFGHQDFRKTSDMYPSYQRPENEENQFSWSPSKIPQFLDTSQPFVPSTLPTLVGDLALNTPVVEQKVYKDQRARDSGGRARKTGSCEGQSSFLSVSQLVDQNQENGPAKVASRRNSGNRSKAGVVKSNKRASGRSETGKEIHGSYQKNEKPGFASSNMFNEVKQPSRTNNNSKNIRSSYSAEALIGIQEPSQRNATCQSSTNKTIVPNFLNENMYFPSLEVSQDNNSSYMHSSGQTYHQSNTSSFTQNFTTTFHNNASYSNNFVSTITSSYVASNTFMSTSNTQDFLGDATNLFQSNVTPMASSKEKCHFSKNYYRQVEVKDDKNQSYSCKKVKKRTLNDNVLPNFDLPFLSMPGAINSPVLPDDFHTTYLPPTTIYSCKNPLYSKPNTESIPNTLMPPLAPAITGRATVQHPQMSPSVNSAGTTLANFNLSTIFPEINKGLGQEPFIENRSKDFAPSAKPFGNSSSHHIGSFPI
ncbi:mucin-3A-like [Euwallacea fornicatus]|uniref:mucin-3A-like n=1 Tax=Euwallacea fornicatus TaxID=995702 RepID=UPI0033901980